MQATYTDATSTTAKQRLLSQYGYGLKRYGAVASWDTLAACWFLDFIGIKLPNALKLTNHPAQLHYGIWDRVGMRRWNTAIRRASDLAVAATAPRYDATFNLVHFGSGWGGVDLQVCKANTQFSSVGITIDPSQIEIANELARLNGLSDRVSFVNQNFLQLLNSKFENKFDGGIAIESLCHVPANEFPILWENIKYVLKPGSKFVVHDWYLEKAKTPETISKIEVFLRGWDMAYCPTVAEFSKAAVSKGFRLCGNTDYTQQILKSAQEIYVRALVFQPLVRFAQGSKSKYLQSLGLDKPDCMDFIETCVIQKELFTSGVLSYRQLVFES